MITRLKWQPFDPQDLPRDNERFSYGMYSVPLIVADSVARTMYLEAVRWEYDRQCWVHNSDVSSVVSHFTVTHWVEWPKFSEFQ